MRHELCGDIRIDQCQRHIDAEPAVNEKVRLGGPQYNASEEQVLETEKDDAERQ